MRFEGRKALVTGGGRGIEKDRAEVWVGPTNLLRILDRVSPRIVQHILR